MGMPNADNWRLQYLSAVCVIEVSPAHIGVILLAVNVLPKQKSHLRFFCSNADFMVVGMNKFRQQHLTDM